MTDTDYKRIILALVAQANTDPFCSIGHWVEHGSMADAIRAALAAQPAEPVAWQQRYIDKEEGPSTWQSCSDRDAAILSGRKDYELRRLYAAPPAPAAVPPLTDEQICYLWSWSASDEAERTASTQQHAFARAIERAHGIGDKHGKTD